MESKSIARLGWLIIAGMLAYWGYVTLFGTGHESKGWEHFAHALKGVSLELGPCNQRPPKAEDSVLDMSPNVLSTGELVSADIGEGERVFHLFLKRAEARDGWQVFDRAKSDYRGFFGFGGKIWLTEMPEVESGWYFLVAGSGRERPARLSGPGGSDVQVLPPELNYTVLKRIRVER